MSNHIIWALFVGLFFGTNLGVLLMSLLAMAKRFDTVEIER